MKKAIRKKSAALKKKAAPKKGGNINPQGKRSGSTKVNKNTNQYRTQVKKKAMIAALKSHLGIVESACNAVGVSRNWHHENMRSDPDYKAAVDELKEVALDFVESRLFKNINSGDVTSTIFYLKTKGKSRGYIERQEIEVKKEGIVKVGYASDEE
jgi:hypothetical protein